MYDVVKYDVVIREWAAETLELFHVLFAFVNSILLSILNSLLLLQKLNF